jgi:hypothetical protein
MENPGSDSHVGQRERAKPAKIMCSQPKETNKKKRKCSVVRIILLLMKVYYYTNGIDDGIVGSKNSLFPVRKDDNQKRGKPIRKMGGAT